MTPLVQLQPLRREWLLATLILTLLASLAVLGRWTWRLDQYVHDAAQSLWAGAPPQDVVIVAIDDESLRALGRWPWRRDLHAEVIERITAARPKAIFLDLLLSEPAPDPAQDARLAQAIAGSGKLVLPVAFDAEGLRSGQALEPIAALAARARLGHIDAEPDLDGVLRWIYLRAGVDHAHLPQAALALLDAAGVDFPARPSLAPTPGQAPASAAEHHWLRDQRHLIRYLFDPAHLVQVSYADLARGTVPASQFADKFVLIGVTAQGLDGFTATPLSLLAGRQTPGVAITAEILAMIRSGVQLAPVPTAFNALLSAVWILGLLLAMRGGSPRQGLTLAVGSTLSAPLVAMAVLPLGWWWAPGGVLVASLSAYPLWSWRRLEVTARLLDEEIRRLSGEPGPAPTLVERTPAQRPPWDPLDSRVQAVRDAAQRLCRARRLLDDILAGLPDATLVVDLGGRVAQANQAALRLLENGVDLIGQELEPLLEHLVPSDAPTWTLLLTRAARQQQMVTSEALDARQRVFLVRLAPLQAPDSPCLGVIVSLADVTQMRHVERQREDLLGFIAHDLRSPQASLITVSRLFRTGDAVMTSQEFSEMVENLAENSLQLCDELLQVMRAENRPLQAGRLDLVQVMADAAQEVLPQARAKHLRLAATRLGEAAWIQGDAYLLRRALVNLLNNAIKFSPPHATISTDIQHHPEYWTCRVQDQGPGISRQDLARLFRRYQRVEGSGGGSLTPGIGLGLVFVDTVARRHGGHVQVDSVLGQGSLFELWLPAEADLPLPNSSPDSLLKATLLLENGDPAASRFPPPESRPDFDA